MPIKNHRLKDANQQGGSKWSAIGRVVKDIVKNPAVREITKEGLKLGVEVGTPILIDKITGKPVNTQEVIREQVREKVAEKMQEVKETYADRLRLIQEALKNKEIDAYQAKELFDRAKEEFNRNQTTGSGIRGQDVLKKLAMKNIQKGRYTKSGGAVVCTKQYPPSQACLKRMMVERAITNAYGLDGSGRRKKGGALPLAAIGAVGLPILGSLAAGLLSPVMEAVSQKHIASKI